jgi:hypothetical protein
MGSQLRTPLFSYRPVLSLDVFTIIPEHIFEEFYQLSDPLGKSLLQDREGTVNTFLFKGICREYHPIPKPRGQHAGSLKETSDDSARGFA